SHNQIVNIDKDIFDIPTLRNLMLYKNDIELLPAGINNISNRNVSIDLFQNPLLRQINTDIQNPELITIDQVHPDLLRNIRYNRDVILSELIVPDDINLDLNIKMFYQNLDIPINERLNLDIIKLCIPFKPKKHTKTKNQIKSMLHGIFQEVKPYKEEEKLAFLMRRIDVYYLYEDTAFHENTFSIDVQKRKSIINYLESIVMIMFKMLPEKKDFIDDTLVRLLHGLKFNSYTTNDDVPCLDGQCEAVIEAYMRLKLGNDCSNAEHMIMEIIANFKIDILKAITTGRGEIEEIEVFLNWKNKLSEELGFQKEINLYGNMSIVQELHDKKYIAREFFNRFTYQTIRAEINKFLRDKESGFKLYNLLGEYVTSIYNEDIRMNDLFEFIQDDTDPNGYIQLENEGTHLLLKWMGYLYKKPSSRISRLHQGRRRLFNRMCAIL
ncbi:Leucine rich repeat protein, partial [Spraguea lophii 42_110]